MHTYYLRYSKSSFENVSSKRKTGQDFIPKSICSNFRFSSNNDWKTYWKFNVNLHNNFRSLYVYSDIASFTFIGDTVAPILSIALCFGNKITLSQKEKIV